MRLRKAFTVGGMVGALAVFLLLFKFEPHEVDVLWLTTLIAIVVGFVPLSVRGASAWMSHVVRFIRNKRPGCPSDMNLLIIRASGDEADAALGAAQLASWIGTTAVNLIFRIASWEPTYDVVSEAATVNLYLAFLLIVWPAFTGY